MLAIQRQSGNHEGTFFFSNLPTYLTWTTAWRKKKSRVLDFRAEPKVWIF